MRFIETALPGVLIVEPKVFGDARGFFMETYQSRRMCEAGIQTTFVQDNQSRSARGVLRGLHYQFGQPQAKLVRVIRGSVFDVCVDLRRSSPAFGNWFGVELSEDNHRQLWIPRGLAHGFYVLSEIADVFYKADDYYAPQTERTLLWDDPALGINWPFASGEKPLLSEKDKQGKRLAECDLFD